MAELTHLPLLQAQRDLLDLPRGWERFGAYLRTMLDDTGDLALPLATFNPMSKPHVAALIDALLAMEAEEIAAAAVAEAAARLATFPDRLRAGLVIADDAQGGWTDRYLTDARHRFEDTGLTKRDFATALIWTGEAPTREGVRTEMLATIYRACYQRRYGQPRTLGAMLEQEGLVALFAGSAEDGSASLAATRTLLARHRDTKDFPVAFACLYGDEAAVSVGYPALGVSPWGGFAVARAAAREGRWDPVEALRQGEADS